MSSDKIPYGWGWVNKLPGNSNTRALLASAIVIGVVCIPKYIMESNKKQGHGYFDSEMPADVRASKDSKYEYDISLFKMWLAKANNNAVNFAQQAPGGKDLQGKERTYDRRIPCLFSNENHMLMNPKE